MTTEKFQNGTLAKNDFTGNRSVQWLCAISVFFLISCTVTQTPRSDKAIIDSLSTSSTEVYQLLSAASSGTTQDGFTLRAERYDNIIGKVEALKLQVNARPMPRNEMLNKIVLRANTRLAQTGGGALISTMGKAPSAGALEEIIANLIKMRDTDKKQGVTADEVRLIKGNINLYLSQALTYEKALNQ
jgi:hypothetical protein